ncbi:MAG: DUF4091 domain-containing protein, partial [Clostridia bacterium]|nr:DUF4091 domain-containing protein [Clostridia bacterium]
KANFAGEVAVIGADGAAKADDSAVATDDSVGDYKAMIYGDVNRDGKIALADVSCVLQNIAGWDVSVNTFAADVDKTGKVNLSDITKLLKYIAGWDDVSLGNVRLVFENTKLEAEHESADLDLYFESPLVKISRSDTANTGENAYKIKTAKNETESCQFFISAGKSMEGLTVELTPFEHEYGEGTLTGEMFIHYYYEMAVFEKVLYEDSFNDLINSTGDYYPEPLLPLADSFEVTEGKSQGFTVNVTTPADAAPGMYKAVLTVKDSGGNELKQANIYTYVWDFALPDTPYSKSSFGMSGYGIYLLLGMYEGDDHKTHAEYYDFLLDHNISSYQLPYPITDPRADAYMSDPRVTAFEICGENKRFPDEDEWDQTLANWEKVQTDPVWAEKGHFYYVDEPYSPSGAELVKAQHEYITEKLGTDDFDIIMPFGNSMADLNNNIDMLEFIQPYVDIFVPGTAGFMPNFDGDHYGEGFWTPRQAFSKFGESLPRLQAIKEDPEKELWWYTCVGPTFPWPNLFVHYHGLMTRVIWWQQFMYDTEGFLYWATQADWEALKRNPVDYPSNGDGTLLYLGEMYGRVGPVASWRLTQIRDGFDDFDYLKMAEELVGREAVMKLVNRLTTSVTAVNEDNDLMESLRDEVAKIIVENQVG